MKLNGSEYCVHKRLLGEILANFSPSIEIDVKVHLTLFTFFFRSRDKSQPKVFLRHKVFRHSGPEVFSFFGVHKTKSISSTGFPYPSRREKRWKKKKKKMKPK
jgi:ribosomal protein L37E